MREVRLVEHWQPQRGLDGGRLADDARLGLGHLADVDVAVDDLDRFAGQRDHALDVVLRRVGWIAEHDDFPAARGEGAPQAERTDRGRAPGVSNDAAWGDGAPQAKRADRGRAPGVSIDIPAIDGRLGGGFPRGQLSEIAGRRSSGRTGLLLRALAASTARGELAALVDALDMFDVASAVAAGVDLTRLLWIRGHVVANPGMCRDMNQRAMEQSLKALTLVLHESATERLADVPLPAAGDVLLVVGPEGGITPEELDALRSSGARIVRLGPTVLRASTAAAVALGALGVLTARW